MATLAVTFVGPRLPQVLLQSRLRLIAALLQVDAVRIELGEFINFLTVLNSCSQNLRQSAQLLLSQECKL